MRRLVPAAFLILFATGVAAQQPPAQPPVKGAMSNLGRPTKATDEVPPLDFEG